VSTEEAVQINLHLLEARGLKGRISRISPTYRQMTTRTFQDPNTRHHWQQGEGQARGWKEEGNYKLNRKVIPPYRHRVAVP